MGQSYSGLIFVTEVLLPVLTVSLLVANMFVSHHIVKVRPKAAAMAIARALPVCSIDGGELHAFGLPMNAPATTVLFSTASSNLIFALLVFVDRAFFTRVALGSRSQCLALVADGFECSNDCDEDIFGGVCAKPEDATADTVMLAFSVAVSFFLLLSALFSAVLASLIHWGHIPGTMRLRPRAMTVYSAVSLFMLIGFGTLQIMIAQIDTGWAGLAGLILLSTAPARMTEATLVLYWATEDFLYKPDSSAGEHRATLPTCLFLYCPGNLPVPCVPLFPRLGAGAQDAGAHDGPALSRQMDAESLGSSV